MSRPRDKASSKGLLPRMEARRWADGVTVSYRYLLASGKWMPLGTDKAAAIRKVLDINERHTDAGSIARLWEQYQASTYWRDLKPRTQKDYAAYAKWLLKVFAEVQARDITPPDVARYLRVERGDAPVRANREVALLGILIGFAVERGEATLNPCRGHAVRRNKERPRTEKPDEADLRAIVAYAESKGGQWKLLALAAEFAAWAGPRQMEFLPLHWPAFTETEARWPRGKQRLGAPVLMERVEVGPELMSVRGRLLEFQRSPLSPVFPNRYGNPYTSAGFAAMWGKLMREMVGKQLLKHRPTFHDLRAFFTTEYTSKNDKLPNLHANPETTARVYERSKEAKRQSL